ncbi:hypothetical protein H4582DRAFT_2059533 [Lactarius indigo]|nr:hypothetical protein H4582DRAFT_2059533 [Lactarius indigo]
MQSSTGSTKSARLGTSYASNTPSITIHNLPASYSDMPVVPLLWIYMFATKPPTLSMIPEGRIKEIIFIGGGQSILAVYRRSPITTMGPACKTGQCFNHVPRGKGVTGLRTGFHTSSVTAFPSQAIGVMDNMTASHLVFGKRVFGDAGVRHCAVRTAIRSACAP